MKEVMDTLNDFGFEDSVVFTDPYFCNSIVGITSEGNVVYGYEKMVNELAEEYMKEGKSEEEATEEAIEWIEFNTLRSLPYIDSSKRPIIIYEDFFKNS